MEEVQSGSLRYIVSLPQQNTRVAFENYGSFERYVDDLRAKHIKHEIKIDKMNVREFIRQEWASDQHAADDLGVSLRTIKNWMAVNPTGILKHSGHIIQMDGVEPLQLFDAVAETIEQINEKRPR